MPVPKAVKAKGKNALPPRRSKKADQAPEPQEAPEAPAQLELVPQAPEEEVVLPEPVMDPSEGILITVKSCKLKEGKNRRGNSVYRSCTGKDANGKGYWWGIELEDAETGKRQIVDSSSPQVRERYRQVALNRSKGLELFLRRLSVDQIRVTVGDDYLLDLIAFFRRRESRR